MFCVGKCKSLQINMWWGYLKISKRMKIAVTVFLRGIVITKFSFLNLLTVKKCLAPYMSKPEASIYTYAEKTGWKWGPGCSTKSFTTFSSKKHPRKN